MKAKFVKLRENAHVPTQGSEKAAGFDLYAAIDKEIVIREGSWMPIPTGLAITPPEGYFGAIFARSGLSIKKGLRPANCVGICDEDYTGEYIVALRNDSDSTETVQPGDRIAQLVFLPYINVEFEEVSSLDKTERGAGGFGSTGTN
jgi:dUTP pyrophosphatase